MTKFRYNVLITSNPGTRRATETFEMFWNEAEARAFIAENAKADDQVGLIKMEVRETEVKGLWRPYVGSKFYSLEV